MVLNLVAMKYPSADNYAVHPCATGVQYMGGLGSNRSYKIYYSHRVAADGECTVCHEKVPQVRSFGPNPWDKTTAAATADSPSAADALGLPPDSEQQ